MFLKMQILTPFLIFEIPRPRNVFLRKFNNRVFSRYDIPQKILKSNQNLYKWAVSPFYSLAQYYLLPEHEKKLGGKKTWVKMQICKLRRIILSLTFLAMSPAPDPLFTLNPRHKRWMISLRYKKENHPSYRSIYDPLCSSHGRKNGGSKILSQFFTIFF